MEISEWKKNYFFLNHIWKLYEKYHEPSIENDHNLANFILCEKSELFEGMMPTVEYKNLCKRIIKNLHLLYKDEDNDVGIDINERCKILNNCIYKEINQHSISDNIIKKIFDDTYSSINGLTPKIKCSYSSNYKDIYKDDRIILLSNFVNNIVNINSILTTKNEIHYCSCRRFVNDCVNIYKDISENYCTSTEDKERNNKGTCDIIQEFTTLYMGYIYDRIGTAQKFPSLHSTTDTTIDTEECALYYKEQSLASIQGNPSDSSTAHKLTTSVAAMAGISSALTLLYKFTPAGKLINLRLRGSGGRISNFDYVDGANDLLLDTSGNNVFNSYNIGYEAA